MQKANPLIRTKLHLPFTRLGTVARPRLQEQVTEGLCGPLTLITAPAGFGKTTLAASCVTSCGMPVAWLSLDKDDNQSGRFLEYLAAAVQKADPAIGNEAAQLATGPQPAPPEAVLTSLINDLDAAGRDMALVLDDYQFINSQAVHEAVVFLLEHCPSTFHVVITTRSDPPLPLARLRARGQTVELRAADLSFTEGEAAQFLNEVMGLRLDSGAVAALEERTEGWIAGLQMAALSMRDRQDVAGFIESFSGTNRYILDYLLEEVLTGLPTEIQRFLLHTSILERLTAPLCEAVLADDAGFEPQSGVQPAPPEASSLDGPASILEHLDRANLFLVPLDDDRTWYRYHHLFADLLRAQLEKLYPKRSSTLQARAAAWCEQNGQVAEAVDYALAARNYPQASAMIARYWGPLVNEGQIETVWSWLTALPEEAVRNSALLSVACCWLLWLKGQVDAIEEHLVDAERALGELKRSPGVERDEPDHALLPAMIVALRSFVARYNNKYKIASELAEHALGLVPGSIPPQDSAMLRTLIYLAMGTAYDGAGKLEKAVDAYAESIRLSRLVGNATGVSLTIRLVGALRLLGRLQAAEEACREALEYIQAQGMGRVPAAGVLHIAMADVLLERNQVEAAEGYLRRGNELGQRSGRLDAAINAYPSLARLRLARRDPAGALAVVQEAEATMGEPPPALWMAELLAYRARILAWQGSCREAEHCLDEAVRLAAQDRGLTGARVALAEARVRNSCSRPDEAVTHLAQALAAAEQSGWLGVVIELRILQCLALQRQGAVRQAEAELGKALALAEPEGYARIFLDEGQPMQLLLAQWLARSGPGLLRDYAVHLLSQFKVELQMVSAARSKASPAGGLVEPLSQRELEVLHLIALGRTNQEVAGQLVVSRGTVKAHTASIYRKLDVANRTEAVARAREMGILPL